MCQTSIAENTNNKKKPKKKTQQIQIKIGKEFGKENSRMIRTKNTIKAC